MTKVVYYFLRSDKLAVWEHKRCPGSKNDQTHEGPWHECQEFWIKLSMGFIADEQAIVREIGKVEPHYQALRAGYPKAATLPPTQPNVYEGLPASIFQRPARLGDDDDDDLPVRSATDSAFAGSMSGVGSFRASGVRGAAARRPPAKVADTKVVDVLAERAMENVRAHNTQKLIDAGGGTTTAFEMGVQFDSLGHLNERGETWLVVVALGSRSAGMLACIVPDLRVLCASSVISLLRRLLLDGQRPQRSASADGHTEAKNKVIDC